MALMETKFNSFEQSSQVICGSLFQTFTKAGSKTKRSIAFDVPALCSIITFAVF